MRVLEAYFARSSSAASSSTASDRSGAGSAAAFILKFVVEELFDSCCFLCSVLYISTNLCFGPAKRNSSCSCFRRYFVDSAAVSSAAAAVSASFAGQNSAKLLEIKEKEQGKQTI